MPPHPTSRRRGRERALQCLYGIDHTQYDYEEVLEDFWAQLPTKPGPRDYAEKLIRGVREHVGELDHHIHGALQNWTPERVGPIERNAIRIAVYEMLHVSDVPSRVAINEAIEVVKLFGADEATRFVNGVLDRLRRKFEGEDA